MDNHQSGSKMGVKPRLIIHGGAGNVTPANLPPKSWALYKDNLLRVYHSTKDRLDRGEAALDAATHAVTLFEDCELFNCGKGAVFTRGGTNELEASVMTTRGYHKRACGVVLLKHVRNPIKLAREMLIRGETDGTGGNNGGDSEDLAGGSGGAQGHVCLGGETAESLAKEWGLEMVDERYFWTRKRWEEHRRGLGEPGPDEDCMFSYRLLNSRMKLELSWAGARGLTVDELYDSLHCMGMFDAVPSEIVAQSLALPPQSWDRSNVYKMMIQQALALIFPHQYSLVCAYMLRFGHSSYGRDRWVLGNGHKMHPCNWAKECSLGRLEGWDGREYLPQGTVGCVALDQYGTICVATSTGGLTNKLPCRIGDTPTIGAGFWAEQWSKVPLNVTQLRDSTFHADLRDLDNEGWETFEDIISTRLLGGHHSPPIKMKQEIAEEDPRPLQIHALAMSGTGNGDAFLRLAAARTVGAIVRFSSGATPRRTLASAINQVAGPGGELQQSAEDRWGDGDGEGGIIGIELKEGKGEISFDFNCGGLFRCWGDDKDQISVGVFRGEEETA